MKVKDLYPDDLPSSDFPEIVHQLNCVKNGLEEVDDDYTRQEIYDLLPAHAGMIPPRQSFPTGS